MNINMDEIFIDRNELPKTLSKDEVYQLLEKIQQGDELAKIKLAEHNIRLVLYEVTGRFKTVEYDKKELVDIGTVGLMQAIKTFDLSKKVEFSTYAIRCIDNEILMFLRKLKKYESIDSLDRIINVDKEGNEFKVEDIISDNTNIEEQYVDNETYRIIRQIVENLSGRDKEIIMLYYGFYNDRVYNQSEIANKFNISQPQISKLIKRIVSQLKEQLKQKGIIDLKVERQKNLIKK